MRDSILRFAAQGGEVMAKMEEREKAAQERTVHRLAKLMGLNVVVED